MKKSFGEYQRIARSALGFSSVWLGEDHLLYIRGTGFLLPFSEEYKRFRYRDIQALAMARTSGRWLGAFAYLVGLLIATGIGFGLLFAREPGDVGLLVVTLAGPLPLAILMLGLMIRQVVLGPRCVFEVQTGLKRERLGAVNRVHRGREAMARLSERITSAQSDLVSAEENDSELSARAAASHRRPEAMQVPRQSLPAFGCQMAAAGGLLLVLHFSSQLLSGLVLLAGIIGAIPLLIALIAGARHPAPDALRQILWGQLFTALLLGATGMVYYMDQAINDPAFTVGVFGPLEAFADIATLGGFAFYLIFLVGGIAHFAIAVAGLIQCNRWRQRLAPASSHSGPEDAS